MRLHAASVKSFLRTALMAGLITLVVGVGVFSLVDVVWPSIQESIQLNSQPPDNINPNLIPPACYPDCTPAELTPTVSDPANP